jgi:hypothetical protein
MNTNSSITELNELPKYFAIKKDYDNLYLWNKYITWLNKTYDVEFSGYSFSYYGYDGFLADWFSNINSFRKPVTEITLEQWDNIVNKKDEFVLPEKWCVERNSDNYLILNNYFNSKFKKKLADADGYLVSPNYSGSSPKEWAKPTDYTEITFEEFKKYVLKQDYIYTIEDLKNGKCAVINDGTIEELDKVLSTAEGKPCNRVYIIRNTSKYYWNQDGYFWGNQRENKYNLPTQSVKEFIKQINMNKEIFGYKLVKEKYKESVKKILNAPKFPLESSPKLLDFKIDSEWYYLLKEAGVLDLWFEPVYKEDKTLPKINGYQGELIDDLNGYFIKYGCATFNIQFINELHGLIGRNKVLFGNKDIKSIKLNSDVEITTEQIKQIYEYIQEKL